jgi:hypothetical protein
VRRLDFKSSWGRQRSRAGSTPVIFRQNASPDVLQPLVILSIQIFSTAQYSIGFRNTWSKVL